MTNRPDAARSRPRITAVLGPTNTGKTHLAMERMLGHESGMIGFPLRLLARENYDRAVRQKGARSVALITGEEKIVPPEARWFLCTVESMPVDRSVAFLAVDEIQTCADPDRGHVFTERLLHARGTCETMVMGAETVRPLLRRLVPEARVETRARFSSLSYSGPRKLQRLPPRSAIVAFSTADVYALAELVRRQRGGAAIVLGALSPRTRNAQVAMYQAGEVDYLVATDAIGMGLNMDINHVAFAATRKFDGRAVRELSAAELAQIAGRAGRGSNNGTFGTTADIGPMDAEVVEAIESHRFDPLQHLHWRSQDLVFNCLDALRASLARKPQRSGLVRVREADDEVVLATLARDPEVVRRCHAPAVVRLLWEVCQIPDFRKVMSDAHAHLLGQVFTHLTGGDGRLPTDWVAQAVDRLDRTDGDIDALTQRIAHIRTWTYVSYRQRWIDDAVHWQERTREIEDRLSDALHERLIHRFVDRRSAVLVGRIRNRQPLTGSIAAGGDVTVEGEYVGTMAGFRFIPDAGSGDDPNPSLSCTRASLRIANAAAIRALRGEMPARVRRLEDDPEDAFAIADGARITWHGHPVARLTGGHDILRPRVDVDAAELLEGTARDRVQKRLSAWIDAVLDERLQPLFRVQTATLGSAARGVAFQVVESLGSLPRHLAQGQLAAVDEADRRRLQALGLRLGRETVYFPRLVKPEAVAMRRLLWAVHHGIEPPPLPKPGRVSVGIAQASDRAYFEAIGYRPLGRLAVRVDIVERLASRLSTLAADGAFAPPPDLCSSIGCGPADLRAVLADLGYAAQATASGTVFRRRRRTGASPRPDSRRQPQPGQNSPFAKLRDLAVSR